MAETTTTTATQGNAENTATEQQNTATATTHGNAGSTDTAQNDSKANDFEALIQRAVDRATNKLGNENKKLRGEIETLKKANMTDAELRQHEMQEKEKEIAEREKALTEKENRLIAIKAIKEIGLDDGSDASLAIVDFVMAEDENGIRERVKEFDALVKRIVQAKVDGVFKANGRTPGVGNDAAADTGAKNDSIAVRMGKNAAQTNKNAQSVLDHYIGGKK